MTKTTNASTITAASLDDFTILESEITLTPSAENANILTATTSKAKPETMETDAYNTLVWAATKKAVKTSHIKKYKLQSADIAVINAVYNVSFAGTDDKKITIPLIALLQGEDKKVYNNKALMLQNATMNYINTPFTNLASRAKAQAKLDKDYENIIQWAFNFLIEDRTDGVKVYANLQDVDTISGMLLKLKEDKVKTIGEPTIQAFIEFAYRQKVANKPYFVELYSVIKEQNSVTTKPAPAKAPKE